MTPFERWLVLGSGALTTATGVVYLWMKYFLEPPDPWAVIHHPLQPAMLKAHILVAPVLVFAVGMISLRHIWRHFVGRVRLGRKSGLVAAASLVPMVATGYLIQAITHEGVLRAVALTHIGVGILFAVGLAIHYPSTRRGRAESSRGPAAPARAPAAAVPGVESPQLRKR